MGSLTQRLFLRFSNMTFSALGCGHCLLALKLQTPPLTPCGQAQDLTLQGWGCCTPSEHPVVWTLSLGVEVTDPTPDPLRSGTRPDPTGAGMLHPEQKRGWWLTELASF